MSGSQDRTEAATPKRLQQARDQGNSVVSRDMASLAGLAAACAVLAMAGPAVAAALGRELAAMLGVQADPVAALRGAMVAALVAAGPIVAAVAGASAAATLVQTGFAFTPALLVPDLSRLSPARGLRRLVGTHAVTEAVKSTIKLAVLVLVAARILVADVPLLKSAAMWLPGQLAAAVLHMVTRLMLHLLAAQAVIAGADLLWQRYRHAQDLRMTKQEVQDEAKETDGNPHVKQRLRQIRAIRGRKRMMAAVPKATVVLTNPTHYAIALSYQRGNAGAPRVVAKGVDEVAARIRQIARDAGVPIVANPPLARALYSVDLDAEIPPEHFKLVAEVIAYVWRLGGRRVA